MSDFDSESDEGPGYVEEARTAMLRPDTRIGKRIAAGLPPEWSSDSDSDCSLDYDDTGQKAVMDVVQKIFWRAQDDEAPADKEDGTGRVAYVSKCRELHVTPVLSIVNQLGSPELDLFEVGLRPKDMNALGSALAHNQITRTITLQGNILGPVGGLQICTGLKANMSLTNLNLSGCHLGRDGGVALAELLPTTPWLKALDVGGNRMGDYPTAAVTERVVRHPAICELNVSNNGCGVKSGEALTELVRRNKLVTDLDLSWNNFAPTTCADVFHSVTDSKTLKSLKASWIGVGQEGADAIIQAIAKNSSLTLLDLAHARIDASASQALANAIEKNNNLLYLRLDSNALGPDVNAVNRVLRDHKSIITFSMNNCAGDDAKNTAQFNELNPSGHYVLTLSDPRERKIAQKLSELGTGCNGESWRNETLDGVRFSYPKDYMWATPSAGKLEFDYVHIDRATGPPMESGLYDRLLGSVRRNFTDASKLVMIKNSASAHCFDSLQALSLIQCLSFEKSREEACVALFSRIVDHHNSAPMMCHSLSPASRSNVGVRLGPLNIFNRTDPSGHYRLDLAKANDRDVLRLLWDLGSSNMALDKGFKSTRLNDAVYHLKDPTLLPQTGMFDLDFVTPVKDNADELSRVMTAVIENMRLQGDAKLTPEQTWNPFHRKTPMKIAKPSVAAKAAVPEERPKEGRARSRASSRQSGSSGSRPGSRTGMPARPPSQGSVTSATMSRLSRRNSANELMPGSGGSRPPSQLGRATTPTEVAVMVQSMGAGAIPGSRGSSRAQSRGSNRSGGSSAAVPKPSKPKGRSKTPNTRGEVLMPTPK